MMKLKKPFNPDMLYNHIVHYYIDKKGVTKEDANKIAQNVIIKELRRHICQVLDVSICLLTTSEIRTRVSSLIVHVQNLLKMYNLSEEFQFGIN